MGTRLLVVALVLLSVPALLPTEVAAEDVDVSTTFLTFFKNGGGYIEYTAVSYTHLTLPTTPYV